MDDDSLSELREWIDARRGKQVYLEVGFDDPDLADTVFAPVCQHVTLGARDRGTNTDHDRPLDYVLLGPPDQRSRLYFDPAHITGVNVHGGAVRVYFRDAMYVGLSG